MIVVKLMGGMGNQMFQYAAGRKLALKYKTDLKLDLGWYLDQPSVDTKRFYELGSYDIKADLLNRTDQERKFNRFKQRFSKKLQEIREQGQGYNPSFENISDNSALDGFWQNERYFKDIRDVIREDFTVRFPLEGKNKEIAAAIENTTAISAHVRRSDYVSNPEANKFHGLAPLDYYKESTKQIMEKVKDPHFFIFSDDPSWCKENLKFEAPTIYVDHNPIDKGYEDIRLMSMCDHHIIANSTFSWWGAWLNPSKDKIVYAPKRWFNDEKANAEYELPEEWIRL